VLSAFRESATIWIQSKSGRLSELDSLENAQWLKEIESLVDRRLAKIVNLPPISGDGSFEEKV
jgi:hypothetical protein